MATVVYERNGVRRFSDGTIELADDVIEALADAASRSNAAFEGDDDDDDEANVGDDDEGGFEGEDDAETVSLFGDMLGAKPKRKNAFTKLMESLSKKKKKKKQQSQSSHQVNPVKMTQEALNRMTESAILDGSQDVTAAGDVELNIRPQHDFHAQDITFEGSTTGARVKQIWFGARSVYQSNGGSGVPVTLFNANNQLRGLLKGASVKAGLDIRILMSMTQAGTASVAITGLRPRGSTGC